MGILSWVIVGLIAGWLAGVVIKGRGYGLLGNILIGIVGALIGGYLATGLLGIADPINGVNVGTIVVAFLGAVVTIALVRLLPGPSPV
jgi:uncharacterized membrane protein YeaQ/YmgE (transglycosylase-associated protein family)